MDDPATTPATNVRPLSKSEPLAQPDHSRGIPLAAARTADLAPGQFGCCLVSQQIGKLRHCMPLSLVRGGRLPPAELRWQCSMQWDGLDRLFKQRPLFEQSVVGA